MTHKRFAPRRRVIVTLRRIPHHFPAEEGTHHEDGVEQHAHRRQQYGEQHLQQQRQRHAEKSTVLFGAFTPDEQNTQQLRQEQQHHRRGKQGYRQFRTPLRPDREQLARLQKVLRLGKRMDYLQRGRQREEHKP